MKFSDILGLNARAQLYSYTYNKNVGKSYASSKLSTKRVLKKKGVPVPDIYAKFANPRKVISFDWTNLPDAFALKLRQLRLEEVNPLKLKLRMNG